LGNRIAGDFVDLVDDLREVGGVCRRKRNVGFGGIDSYVPIAPAEAVAAFVPRPRKRAPPEPSEYSE
jgi:hypothetical protein